MTYASMTPDNLHIRAMSRSEFDILVGWAAYEGWNPGLYDANIFWHTDPDGFIAAEINGELIGGGSIVSYQGNFGFMGFFIIKPAYRGHGLGRKLWFARRRQLESRLSASACISMDGVFDMQTFYSKGGFKFSHREIRFQGTGSASPLPHSVTPLSQIPFESVVHYDSAHFPTQRAAFLKEWITQPESLALGIMEGDHLAGYGVIRRCQNGFKIGPLFADNIEFATDLFNALSSHADREAFFIDVPEINDSAMQLVKSRGLKEVFGCARMYFGNKPILPDASIYAITTFELG